jgi:hypothetical protein
MTNKEDILGIISQYELQMKSEEEQRAREAQEEARKREELRIKHDLQTKIQDQATRIIAAFGTQSEQIPNVTLVPPVSIQLADRSTAKIWIHQIDHYKIKSVDTPATFISEKTGSTIECELTLSENQLHKLRIFTIPFDPSLSIINLQHSVKLLDYTEQELQKGE